MTRIAGFFHGADTTLGVFYPSHCITAVFPNYEITASTANRLRHAGFSDQDVLAATGAELIEHEEKDARLGHLVMQAISRLIRTEQADIDHDVEHARHGAGFLIARCPTEKSKREAWSIIKSADPLDARYYSTGAVEHLAGDPDTD